MPSAIELDLNNRKLTEGFYLLKSFRKPQIHTHFKLLWVKEEIRMEIIISLYINKKNITKQNSEL
jgi:hypothetical protein